MKGTFRRWLLTGIVSVGAFVACNQIVGVDDVILKQQTQPGGDDDSGPIVNGGDDDSGPVSDATVPEDPHPSMGLGFDHTCARMLDGTVKCWGQDFNGQLGDGVSVDGGTPEPQDSLNPKSVAGVNDAIAIASGTDHTCIARKSGKVSCWGSNFAGNLGNGTTTDSSVPVDVSGMTDAINVGAGGGVTCAVHKDGTASCWGANSAGGLGDGTTNDSNVPVKVKTLTGIVDIRPSTNATCALTGTGDVYCWGAGSDGQLGTGSTADTPTPTKLTSLSSIAKIAVASRFACALQTSGSVFCWGRNDTGQLGNGSPSAAPNPSPILVANLTDATSVWAGYGHACATRKNGQVACWGDGTAGQLGTGTPDANGASSPTPVAVPGISTAKAVYAGGDHTCIVTSSNTAQCWGQNLDGQIGNGASGGQQDTPAVVNNFP